MNKKHTVLFKQFPLNFTFDIEYLLIHFGAELLPVLGDGATISSDIVLD